MWFSNLRRRMASWLSPRDVPTSLPSIPLESPLDPGQLDKLSGLLSTLLNMDQSSMLNLVATLQLARETADAQLQTARFQMIHAQSATLPHRIYSPGLSHDGVSWIAQGVYANDSKLVGRGDCPAKALNDFDTQWLGIK